MQTVFIVESDPVLLRTYSDVLSGTDLQVVTFRTASLAVKALDKLIPDVILLELALPGHNGFELLYELRSYADTRNVKVIVNSLIKEDSIDWSYVRREDFGIVHYMYKPQTTLEQLSLVVQEHTHAD
jgi:CheY-like chemotaxis protein